ncbi:MAG: anthranilate phosphoribosyltransferase [Gemmatimonadota bacterium]
MSVTDLLDTLRHRSLDQVESFEAFTDLVRGHCSEIEIAALLAALKTRGETPPEIAGAAQALRASALPFPKPAYSVADTCGTGGDGAGTVNISTAAAFIAAECGVPVAKHGNRAISSRSGSADVLEALGVKLDPAPEVARRCLDEAGVCFLFAPAYHPGIKQAMGVRRALRTRTLFNLLGPLANPALPEWQVVGVYDAKLCRPLAETLQLLGCRAALVVNGGDLDEIALHGPTTAARLHDGRVDDLVLEPEHAGAPRSALAELSGGDPIESAAWLAGFLAGKASAAHQAAVAINAGAMLWVAAVASDLEEGYRVAHDAIRSGRAAKRLARLAEVSHGT